VFDGLESEDGVAERNVLGQLVRYRYPFAGRPREQVVTVTDGGRTRVTRRALHHEEVERPYVFGLTRSFEERPLSRASTVFEVAESEWTACVAALDDGIVEAAQVLDLGTVCAAPSLARIRSRATRFENYDEFSHPRRVVDARLVPGGTTAVRTTTTETYFEDYSGGPGYLGAVPFSTRAASWLLDQPDFVRVTDMALVAGLPETRTRLERMLWNARGELVAHVREPGLDPDTSALGTPAVDEIEARLTTSIWYDSSGNPDRVERASETGEIRIDDFGYDEDGVHLRWTRNAAGHLSYVGVHPAFGAPVVSIDPNGVTDRYEYDGFGRLRGESMAGGGGRLLSYGNRTITESRNGGGRRVVSLDRLGRVTTTSALGLGTTRTTAASYDERGMVASITRPSTPTARGAVVSPSFDQLGRLTRLRTRSQPGAPLVLRETRRYIVGSTLLSAIEVEAVEVTEADGDQQRLHIGIDGTLTRSSERNDTGGHSAVRFDSGAFGLPSTVEDSEGNVMTMEHDILGRPIVVDDPDRGIVEMTYNAFDEVVTTSRDGVGTTAYTRDSLGRVTLESTGGYLVAYEFDTAPNGIGRVASAEAPGGMREEYVYDAQGRRRQIFYARGATEMLVNFGFDATGRLSTITYPEVGGERLVVNYRYDLTSGVLSRVDSADGVLDWRLETHDGYLRPLVERAGSATVEHEYDSVFGVETATRIRHGTGPAAPIIHDVEVSTTLDGNVSTRRDLLRGRTEAFKYDRRDRLRVWESVTGTGSTSVQRSVVHTYSDGGRLISVRDRERVAGGPFTTVAQEAYLYEGLRGAGPRAATEQVVTRGPSVTSTLYEYESGRQTNAGGRSVAYTHFDLPSAVSDGVTRVYDYDADRRRARVREPQGETTVYAGSFFERRMNSLAAADNVVHVYGADGLVAQLRRSDAATSWSTEYVHTDHLGSATVTTDPEGNIVSEQWFGPFGRRLGLDGRDLPAGSGAPDALRVGFTGHEQEDALGLVDMRGRFYDPSQRRFLTPDPLVAEPTATQSWSPYSYVRNNPLSRIDPSGWIDDASGFEDEPGGFIDEGAWDTSGMDADDTTGASSGAPGGYDDFDDGDVDFDPGDGFVGQDEEGGNDGADDYSASGSKQTTSRAWIPPPGFEFDGPEAQYFIDLLRETMAQSPSVSALVNEHSRSGRAAVRMHTRRGVSDIPFGAAAVRVRSGGANPGNQALFFGDSGEHALDRADFDLLPTLSRAGMSTSRNQMLVHEIAEAIAETYMVDDAALSRGDVRAQWQQAHQAAFRAENAYRADVGQRGTIFFRGIVGANAADLYNGAQPFAVPLSSLMTGVPYQ
jgi:RHS repeat-associated protein